MRTFGLACSLIVAGAAGLNGCTTIAGTTEPRSLATFSAVIFEPSDTSTFDVDTISIDWRMGKVLYGGNTSLRMDDCKSDRWICTIDGYLDFAVPTDWDGEEDDWSREGIQYTVISQDALQADSYYIKASRVADTEDREAKVYLFSPKHGLLSITVLLKNSNGDYVPVTYVRLTE